MPNNYIAPYEFARGTYQIPEGQFTVPICTTPERFSKIMSALWAWGALQGNEFDFDHLIDFLDAIPRITDGCIEIPSNCRTLALTDERISWFPENPFEPNAEVPEGYPFHPFTVVTDDLMSSIIAQWGLGFQIGDVFTDITKLPVFTGWDDILENYANMPHLRLSVEGTGTAKFHVLNIPLGGRLLIVIDNEINLFNLRTIEVGRDNISFPPETQVEFIVEVEISTQGEHTIDLVCYPVIDNSLTPFVFGAGWREVEVCGFGGTMTFDPCCPDTNDKIDRTNQLLEKIVSFMSGGMRAIIKFDEGTLPPDEGAGDCAPDHFDHNGEDETTTELIRRNKALCLAVNQYVKAVLLKVLRDMSAPQALIDFVGSKFPDVTVPITLSNLTVVYPVLFSGLNTFFDALTDNIDLSEVACAMYDALTGDKNNTFVNFRDSLVGYTTEALMQSFVDLVSATNGVQQNYKDFNTTLNANNDPSVDSYECPCGAPPPSGECGGFIPVDWNGSGTTFEYMGNCVWKINSGSGSPYNSSMKDLYDRPFFIDLPEPEEGYPLPGCSNSAQIGACGTPDQIGGCNFSTGLWGGCYVSVQWDSGTPNYYKLRLCTELDGC